uniref:Reverse transcriptase domain-containing protein n=1 Tax=Haemonchus contortus TaxID=6289 RepID=A0A7I4XX64_HAECO
MEPINELDVDIGTTPEDPEETIEAIQCLRNGRAPGIDEIPAKLLKAGGSTIVKKPTELYNGCWNGLTEKANLTDGENWRRITLLSVPGKAFCGILLQRLRNAIDSQLSVDQAGFREERSCCEQIFTPRNIIEQCEFKYPLFINFVEFRKAFDSVHRESLWEMLGM